MTQHFGRKKRSPAFVLGVVVCLAALVGAWYLLSRGQSPAVMPSPARTVDALWRITRDGSLAEELSLTLARAALATFAALVIGIVIGAAASRFAFADGMLAPVRALLQGLPPIVLIVCLVLWLGSDPVITVIVCATVMVPLVAAATTAALRGIDPHLLELGAGLQLGRTRRLAFVTVPSVAPPILAATGAVASGSVRIAVMAELLSAPDGVGAAIAQTRTLLQTPELYAWALALVACALVVDVAVRAVVTRWTGVFAPSARATVGPSARATGRRSARAAVGRTTIGHSPGDTRTR
ncbi:ABC transporter permease subunit [Rhodococcus sp. HNM0569]|uniref:ABC transporter permease n=1 Tax=Rhodococcus sp. HNM0569 TaxID=2716340 RepID=UPI00146ED5B5|nr:ABC transporter permease subunit [Rhodococcus sp. HNM0569]NLU84821.1 ABC transporter permease subunit [Rhodococcus sp. HNM0569]